MTWLTENIIASLKKNSSRNLVTYKAGFFYHRYTYDQIFQMAKKFISLIKTMNLKKRDKIMICSYNCPQYIYVFLGSIFYGTVMVPVDYKSSDELIKRIAKEASVSLLITSRFRVIDLKIKTLFVEDLDYQLKNVEACSPYYSISESDLVEILYTSGTTSEPKGVLLTHENIGANSSSILSCFNVKRDFRFLSIIPLSHSFEQTAGLFMMILCGAQTTHLQSLRPSELVKIFKKQKVNVLVTVPAFLDLLRKSIMYKAKQSDKEELLNKMIQISLKLPFFTRRIIFRSIHKELGGSLSKLVSGGAPLSEETNFFWEALGVKTVQGYGLTEASPLITIIREDNRRIGSCGEVIPGVKVKICSGEILAKGRNITQGYYKNPSATADLFENGWLKTGDIGYFDDDGFLYIKGRKKNMILKSSGLNVYPEDIEKVLDKIPGVKESCVIGLETPSDVIIAAALILDDSSVDPEKIIESANLKLEEHQQIQQHFVWKQKDFPRTPTLKVKRDLVLEMLGDKVMGASEQPDDLLSILVRVSGCPRQSINERSNLYSNLKLDSIKTIELAALIEEKFRIDIDESKITKKTTVKSLRQLIRPQDKKPDLKLSQKYFSRFWVPIRLFSQELVYFFLSFICRVSVSGRHGLDQLKGSYIIIFNHESYFDVPIIIKHLPLRIRSRLAGAAAADHFFVKKNRIDKRIIISRLMQLYALTYPMSRDKDVTNRSSLKKSLELTGEVIDQGYSLLLSPEGTRTSNGKMGRFKKGIGLIVKESGLQVLPVKLEGLFKVLPKGKKFPNRGPVNVKFGKPLQFPPDSSIDDITKCLENTLRSM